MSFTPKTSRLKAERLIDEEIDDTDSYNWANDWLLHELDPQLFPRTTQTFTAAVADTWYDLNDDFLHVTEEGVTNDDDVEYTDYTISGRQIKFELADTYTLNYRETPTLLTAEEGATGTIELPDLFILPLAEYQCFRFKTMDVPEDVDGDKWYAKCRRTLLGIYNVLQLNTGEAYRKTADSQRRVGW